MLSVLILGSTDLTLVAAEAVLEAGCALRGICHVGETFSISYADAPVRNVRFADVEGWCEAHGVEHIAFTGNADLAAALANHPADFALAAGWYHVVPASLRALFPRGCAGVHASLLPELRGGAPLNWAILNGARRTGVSLYALVDEMDAGPLYGQVEITIGPRTDVGELVEASRRATRALLGQSLPGIAAGTLTPRPQQGTPTWGLQRSPADGTIDWSRASADIDRLVRAVTRPYPGARTRLGGRTVLVWRGEPADAALRVLGAPGQIFVPPGWTHPVVVTADGALVIWQASFEADGADALPELLHSSQRRFDMDREPWP